MPITWESSGCGVQGPESEARGYFMNAVLGARCGESRIPVLSPGSKGPGARRGPRPWATPRREAAWALRSRRRRWGARSPDTRGLGSREAIGGGCRRPWAAAFQSSWRMRAYAAAVWLAIGMPAAPCRPRIAQPRSLDGMLMRCCARLRDRSRVSLPVARKCGPKSMGSSPVNL